MWSLRNKETMRQRDKAKGMDKEFEEQGEYATTRQCEGDGWGILDARRLCDNATMRRGWMGRFKSKETMRQRDNAKGMDVEFEKQGDYATTR